MEVWDVLKREVPARVGEINLSLQNCIDTIENTRNLLRSKSVKYMNLEKDQEAMELMQVRSKLLDIINYLESVKCGDISEFIEEAPVDTAIMLSKEIEPDEEELDDDEKYLVDPTIPYKLSEDFMNTKPCAFKLQGKRYTVTDFKSILVKLCEVLYQKNQRLFEKIAREHRIKCGENGRVMICFKQDKVASVLQEKYRAYIASSDIFVFINTNNPTKVYAIRALLSIYHISENSFSVFLKWDKRIDRGQRPIGKLLNIDHDYTQNIIAQVKEKPEIIISQLAYGFFDEYFKDTQKNYDISNFLDKLWCNEVLGIPCPLLKEVNTSKDLKEQTFYRDKNYPSYVQNRRYRINGKIYLICMRWNKQYRDKLEAWITAQDSEYLERLYSKKRLSDKIVDSGKVQADYEDKQEKSDTEKRIGEYARDYFTVYFSQTEKQYDLNNFLNKYWCNDKLGICYPLLKEVDIAKPIADQKNYNNEYARYWTKTVLEINRKYYIMCSEWFKGCQEKLDKWVNEQNIEFPSVKPIKNHQRKKENCLNYDFKKNQCMCTHSGIFTLPCESVNLCEYYTEQEVYVISKEEAKEKYCPCCGIKCKNEMMEITYTKNGVASLMVVNHLVTLRCDYCQKSFINEDVFRVYAKNKNLEDLSAKFIEYKS